MRFKQLVPTFAALLNSVNIDAIEAVYPRLYLKYLLDHRLYYLSIYSDLLQHMADATKLDTGRSVFLDYGAGNGLLGLFARFAGFTQVYLCDTDKSFLEAAATLSTQINIPIAGYIEGDIDKVRNFEFAKRPDVVAGTDVIEHIYDLNYFFKTLSEINPAMVTGFTTGSNPSNLFKVMHLKRLQLKDEYEGSTGNPSDPTIHESYLLMRRKIILAAFPTLDVSRVDILAKRTRGLRKDDILMAGKLYMESGTLPKIPRHPTNTCHPFTGSWTERILALNEYRHIYASNGFNLRIYKGFYNDFQPGLKKARGIILNKMVKLLGKNFSPFIGLVGWRK
jgi:hypothetical protein